MCGSRCGCTERKAATLTLYWRGHIEGEHNSSCAFLAGFLFGEEYWLSGTPSRVSDDYPESLTQSSKRHGFGDTPSSVLEHVVRGSVSTSPLCNTHVTRTVSMIIETKGHWKFRFSVSGKRRSRGNTLPYKHTLLKNHRKRDDAFSVYEREWGCAIRADPITIVMLT